MSNTKHRQTPQRAPSQRFDAARVFQALYASPPRRIDASVLQALCGELTFTSAAEIAEAFGVADEVVADWIEAGAPGAAGDWPAGPLLAWVLQVRRAEEARVGLGGILIRLHEKCETPQDLEQIRELCGPPVRTLREAAEALGVKPATLRQNWRDAGMPGRQGQWDVGEILVWRIEYERELAAKRGRRF
ncbi:MAG: hypothetical protein CMJ58_17360 [Planctomycetaceae bacterium]|nr:hypothetical protein [Planctomycetaceae bacterium]